MPTIESVIPLEDLKQHLNLSVTSTVNDYELQLHLNAATEAVEKRIGPVVNREFTERLRVRNGAACVNHTPLVSVTSLAPVWAGVAGTAYDAVMVTVDRSGVVELTTGRLPCAIVDVTYLAGHGDVISEAHELAILYVAEHFWEMQRRGVGRPGLYGDAVENSPGLSEATAGYVYRGFALPNRALELLSGDEILGFA